MADLKVGDNESSSSGSDVSDDIPEVTEQQLQAALTQVHHNPFSYEARLAYIRLLRAAGDIDQLTYQREKFRELFPLTEEIWIEWISDEDTSPDKEVRVEQLYKYAVADYISPNLWALYVSFTIQRDISADDKRGVFEEALRAVGHHVSEGHELWVMYRSLEMKWIADSDPAGDIDRLLSLFERELAIPNLQLKDTFAEYEQVMQGANNIRPEIQEVYAQSLILFDAHQLLEDAVAKQTPVPAEVYENYLSFEMEKGTFELTQCLWERYIRDHCLNPVLWMRYAKYLTENYHASTVTVLERAVRNVPWSTALWQDLFLALEKFERPESEFENVLQRALNAGLQQATDYVSLWLHYCASVHRRSGSAALRSSIDRALVHLAMNVGPGADTNRVLKRYQAELEAFSYNNLEAAIQIWTTVLKEGLEDYSTSWIEFAQLLLQTAPPDQRIALARAQYQLGTLCETITDLDVLVYSWRNFERVHGTLEEVSDCERECMRAMHLRDKKLQAAQQEQQPQEHSDQAVATSRQTHVKKKNASQEQGRGKKREHADDDEDVRESETTKNATIADSNETKPLSARKIRKLEEKQKLLDAVTAGKTQPPKWLVQEIKVSQRDKDERTLFITDLSALTTESELKQVFSECGTVEDVRIVRNEEHHLNYAYLTLADKLSVDRGLALDGRVITGCNVKVSHALHKSGRLKGDPRHFNDSGEPTTLFVNHLPASATRESLLAIFAPFGNLKDVRYITDRNGRSKGFAYIEFADSEAAQKAVSMDKHILDDKEISVAVSDPAAKKKKQIQTSLEAGGGGGAAAATAPKASSTFMKPRAVARGGGTTAIRGIGRGRGGLGFTGGRQATAETKAAAPVAATSNDEFRKMVLGGQL